MDPVRLAVALGPLAVYLLVLSAINLARRPLVVAGARDLTALGIALSGLVLVGPIELVIPQALPERFGNFAWLYWLLLVSLYFSVLSLVVLMSRPRLTIYNISPEELRPALAEVAAALDPEARWAGDSLALPRLGVELHVDAFGPLRGAALVPLGRRQSFRGWRRLEAALAARLRAVEVPRNPAGAALLAIGLLLLGGIGLHWASDPQAVAEAFAEMLGRPIR